MAIGFFGWAAITATSLGIQILLNRKKPISIKAPTRLLDGDSAPGQWVLGTSRCSGLIVGENRYNGYSSSYMENLDDIKYRDVHIAIAVSEGECEGLSGIWFNNNYYSLTKTSTNADGSLTYTSYDNHKPYSSANGPLFEIIANFNASGMQGSAYRRSGGIIDSVPFLKGISWVHVIIRQPVSGFDPEVRKNLWEGPPEIEFLMKGIKVKDPSSNSSLKKWTESATDLRYWFMTKIQGIDPGDIDSASVSSAKDICDANIETTLDGSYWRYARKPDPPNVDSDGWGTVSPDPTEENPIVWVANLIKATLPIDPGNPNKGEWDIVPWKIRKIDGTIEELWTITRPPGLHLRYKIGGVGYRNQRYTCNGILVANQKFADISDEMDYAWQGKVVVGNDGKYYFRPGTDLDSSFFWDAKNARSRKCTVGPPIRESVNAVLSSISQSSVHNYESHELPIIKDDAEIEKDGFQNNVRLRPATLVNHPISAGRLLATFLRLARQNVVYQYSIKSDDDTFTISDQSPAPVKTPRSLWRNAKPLDVVTMTDSFYGVENRRMVIVDIAWQKNATVDVTLVDAPTGAYDDTIDIPDSIDDRPVVISDVPVPSNVIATVDTEVALDGTSRPVIEVGWDAEPYRAQLRWRVKDIDNDTFVGRSLPLWSALSLTENTSEWQESGGGPIVGSSYIIKDDLDWKLTFEIQVRFLGQRSEGEWSDSIEVTTMATIDELPINLSAVILDKIYVSADAPKRRDIVGIEVSVGTSELSVDDFAAQSKTYPVTPGESISTLIEEVYNASGFQNILSTAVISDSARDIRSIDQFTVADTKVQARFVTVSGAVSDLVTATVSKASAGIRIPPDGHVVLVNSPPTDADAGIKGRLFVKAIENAPPVWGDIPNVTMSPSGTSSINLQDYVSDADDPISTLTLVAGSSDTTKTTVSINGAILNISSKASLGNSTITVTATDPDGASATKSFTVTVANIINAPTGFSAIAGDNIVTLNWTRPSGTYAKTQYRQKAGTGQYRSWTDIPNSSNAGVTTYAIGRLINGEAYTFQIRVVTAEGEEGAPSVERSATPMNMNRAPVWTAIPDQSLDAGSTKTIDLSRYASDPDNDTITYDASSGDETKATVSLSGSMLTITATSSPGNVDITVTAQDPGGLTANQIISTKVISTALYGVDSNDRIYKIDETNAANSTLIGTLPNTFVYTPRSIVQIGDNVLIASDQELWWLSGLSSTQISNATKVSITNSQGNVINLPNWFGVTAQVEGLIYAGNGNAYALLSRASANYLRKFTIDETTGAISNPQSSNASRLPTGQRLRGMTRRNNGDIFIIDTRGNVYKIDISSGTYSSVGQFPTSIGITLCIGELNGSLYYFSGSGRNTLYTSTLTNPAGAISRGTISNAGSFAALEAITV